MSKRRPKYERSRGGGMRPEDDALWQAFSKGITPGRLKPRVPEAEAEAVDAGTETVRALLEQQHRSLAAPPHGAAAKKTKAQKSTGAGLNGAGPARAAVRTGPGNIDAKAVRRLGSGRLTVDARIDLHGMRQSEAHSALRAFLWRAVAKGNRMVLVITGKGGRRAPAAADFGDAAWLGDASIEPGVLRQQVPLWLREPEFAPLVVGYTTAHIRHGGEGALYVQLRRRG